jgi:hypothetical protein
MQRRMCVYALASILILTLATPASGGPGTPPRQSHHAGHADRVTALPYVWTRLSAPQRQPQSV